MLRNSNQDTRPQNAQPRVAPVTPPYDADTAAALEVLGPPIGIFRVFARRPDRAHGLVAGVGEEGAVDALLICGWYHAISYVARATRLAPEPDAPLFAGFGASSRVGRVRLATAGSTGAGPKRRELTMAVAVTLDKALDKAYENKSLEEILDAPVAALAGVSDGDAEKLAAAFGIKTVRDLGSSKYFAVAQALVALDAHSG
jgi:hypothetical protein